MTRNILAFDVANNITSVAIAQGQKVIAYQEELRPSMQAEKLISLIELTLQETKLEYDNIDYLAVTVGTGSFTGIRIGIAAAKAILYASSIKPLGVTNFELSFYRLKMQIEKFDRAFIILNAYRNQLYIQEFTSESQSLPPRLVDYAQLVTLLQVTKGRVACSGNGIEAIFPQIKQLENLAILPRFPVIKAMHLARYANEKIEKKLFDPIEPLYIRPPDAIIPKN